MYFKGNSVDLTLDCCFAGKWIDAAIDYYKNLKQNNERLGFNLYIQAYSDSDHKVMWGAYRELEKKINLRG